MGKEWIMKYTSGYSLPLTPLRCVRGSGGRQFSAFAWFESGAGWYNASVAYGLLIVELCIKECLCPQCFLLPQRFLPM